MDKDRDFEIFPPFEAFYLDGLRFCVESALKSAFRIEKTLQKFDREQNEGLLSPLLNEAQNIALQAAGTSRFFWPAGKKYKQRGEFLRKVFEIEEESALKNRQLRNAMEHFDEYLDDYLANVVCGIFLPSYVGRTLVDDGIPSHVFRAFYIDTAELKILGCSLPLMPLVNELQKIYRLIEQFDSQGRRFINKK
ncbi:MAG TPA: hypothetical protein VIM58_02550 [Candidatus Methylacidiphilales bacterium]